MRSQRSWSINYINLLHCHSVWYCEGGPLQIAGAKCSACCGSLPPVVRCCILLLRIYGWAVVILVGLGCWVWVLTCDSERIGRCGKSSTNSTRNWTSFPLYNIKKSVCVSFSIPSVRWQMYFVVSLTISHSSYVIGLTEPCHKHVIACHVHHDR